MKPTSLFLLITLLTLFSSCIREEEPIEKDYSIHLSTYSVQVIAGVDYSVDVLSEFDMLAISSDSSKVASCWWTNNGGTILIKTHAVGRTIIKVIDRENPTRSAEIEVTSSSLDGDFEVIGDNTDILVSANDASVQAAIESDLKAMAKSLIGTSYSFDKEAKSVKIYPPVTGHTGGQLTGTYEWGMDTLKIHVGSETTVYPFAAYDNNSIVFVVNLVETYRKKYPDVYIGAAWLNHYLSRKKV